MYSHQNQLDIQNWDEFCYLRCRWQSIFVEAFIYNTIGFIHFGEELCVLLEMIKSYDVDSYRQALDDNLGYEWEILRLHSTERKYSEAPNLVLNIEINICAE